MIHASSLHSRDVWPSPSHTAPNVVEEFKHLVHKTSSPFDFIAQVKKGNSLFVGEGNLSFATALAWSRDINPRYMTATTYERRADLKEEARSNGQRLRNRGVRVWHGIDATILDRVFPGASFETIIFQFPHAGSRQAEDGRTRNFILIRNFLRSSSSLLPHDARVLITTIDSPFYRGSFQFYEAAETTGYHPPVAHPFSPKHFPGYVHTNTHNGDSALSRRTACQTWVFSRK